MLLELVNCKNRRLKCFCHANYLKTKLTNPVDEETVFWAIIIVHCLSVLLIINIINIIYKKVHRDTLYKINAAHFGLHANE